VRNGKSDEIRAHGGAHRRRPQQQRFGQTLMSAGRRQRFKMFKPIQLILNNFKLFKLLLIPKGLSQT
jgi:hypothetical protein